MWTEVEGCMAIVVGCLPAMMPLFRGKGFGRRKPVYIRHENVNLVTFGSGGKNKNCRKNNGPYNTPFSMRTTASGTVNSNHTELIDHVYKENHPRYYQGDSRWNGIRIS
jgi:hypothetical protein